jgi:hypothetical protein
MNNVLKLLTTLTKYAGSKYAEAYGILSELQDGFRLLRSIHDALASIIMMMEDAKIYNKDIYLMYADFNDAFTTADHRIIFKHMRQLSMPTTFVDTCEQLYGVSTTNYKIPFGPTLSIDTNRGTLQGDIRSPFLFTLFSNLSSVGSQWAAEAIAPAPSRLTPTLQPRTRLHSPTTTASPSTSLPTCPSNSIGSPYSANAQV